MSKWLQKKIPQKYANKCHVTFSDLPKCNNNEGNHNS